MRTVNLSLGISLAAPPTEVFQALTDPKEHSRFTGGKSVINAKEGGEFSYFDGLVSGVFLDVREPSRIVQSLRGRDWPEGHTATVDQKIEARAEGLRTYVRISEENVPVDHLDAVLAGWSEYWDKLAGYLRERKLDVVERFVQRYKNAHEWDSVDEFITTDCKVHIPIPGLPQGREGMRINGRTVCTAFPDVYVEREFFATEGDIVIERAHAKATHKGELMGLPATNKPVTWTELHAYRVTEGMISEVWSEPDLLGVMGQLGVIDPPRAGKDKAHAR
jgi:predicted ester cyclase/uncharacterized protein YndB with AHSA1/START domain